MRFSHAALWVATLILVAIAAPAARAVEAVNVRLDAAAIDLTDAVERQRTETAKIQVSTAPGADGIIRRMEVPSREGNLNWAVVALANNGDEQVDRLSVVIFHCPVQRRGAIRQSVVYFRVLADQRAQHGLVF